MKRIFLIILISLCVNSSLVASTGLWPMIKITYDKNLGLTSSFGLSTLSIDGSIAKGIYVLASKGKKGRNLSFGVMGGAGGFYGTYGLNRMNLKKDDKSFWGLELSSNFLFHFKMGLMNKNKLFKISDYKINLAAGVGL